MTTEADFKNYQEKINAAEYILQENGILKEEIKQLRKQSNHWRNSSNDANQMLSHIGKQGTNRYADQFYDPALKRIVTTLYKENQILVNKLAELFDINDPGTKHNKHNIAEYVKSNAELSESVQKLKLELEQKFKENRRLQMAIEHMNNTGKTEYGSRLESIERLANKCSGLQSENRNLKASLLLQNNTMVYLKKVVDSLRKEFLELFAKCYAENGQEFLDEMKSLDTKGIPDFLLEPLRKDSATNTDESDTNPSQQVPIDLSKLKIEDQSDRLDSGYTSYNEELRLVTITLKNSKQECETKDRVINDLNLKMESLKKEFHQKERELQQIINDLLDGTNESDLRNEINRLKRQLENAKSESMSWSTALQEKDEEAKHFRRERDEARRDKDETQQKLSSVYEAMNNTLQHQKDYQLKMEQRHRQQQQQQQQYQQQPQAHYSSLREPYLTTTDWLTNNPFRRDQVVADGPTVTRPKRQSSEPTGSSKQTLEFSSSPKRRSPIEASGDGDDFWKSRVESVLQCEFCGEMLPCSILSEHLRTCDKKYGSLQ